MAIFCFIWVIQTSNKFAMKKPRLKYAHALTSHPENLCFRLFTASTQMRLAENLETCYDVSNIWRNACLDLLWISSINWSVSKLEKKWVKICRSKFQSSETGMRSLHWKTIIKPWDLWWDKMACMANTLRQILPDWLYNGRPGSQKTRPTYWSCNLPITRQNLCQNLHKYKHYPVKV